MTPTVRLLGDALRVTAEARPGAEAIVSGSRRIDYGALLDGALRVARGLQDLGVRRGDRVIVHLENGIEALWSVFGASLAGAAFSVVHPGVRTPKLRFLVGDSDARVLISHPQAASALLASGDGRGDLRIVVTDRQANGAGSDAAAGAGEGEGTDEGVNGASTAATRRTAAARHLDDRHTIRFEALLASHAHPRDAGTIPLDLAALIYTSGSTGKPKGVMMSHQAMTFAQASLSDYLGLEPRDKILNVLPLAFDYGLYQALLAVRVGATLILERSFGFPTEVIARIQGEHVTVVPGVPTTFATLLGVHRRAPFVAPSVRTLTNTAATLPPAHVTELEGAFPNARTFAMYGLTECKRATYLDPSERHRKPTSVGKAIPGTEALVLDDDGREVAPGETGVLHVRGPHVMMGYWKRPDETAAMLVPGPLPGERMLRTHDLFRRDADGFLYFVGRSDDVIKRGGEKISPSEIENALHAVPGVRAATVVGVPDDLLGEAVHAFVVREEGAPLDATTLRRAVGLLLEPQLVPRDVTFVPSLPTTSTGKVRRRDLLDLRHLLDLRDPSESDAPPTHTTVADTTGPSTSIPTRGPGAAAFKEELA